MKKSDHFSADVKARTAGVLYLLTIITGLFAQVFVRHALTVSNDSAATASNILANETWYRFGLAADLVMLACYVVVTGLFYDLFRSVSEITARVAAYFSLMGIAILCVNSLNHFLPLIALSGAAYLAPFEAGQLEALARLSLRLHGAGYTLSGVFFGFYCIFIGYLAFRSSFVPRLIGLLMALGGFSFLVSSFITILFPSLDANLPDIALLGGIGELALTIRLIIKGVSVYEVRPEGGG